MIVKLLFILFICLSFLYSEEEISINDILNKTTNQVQDDITNKIESSVEQVEEAMGILEEIDINDFSLDKLSDIDINNLQNFGSIADLDGLNNLDYIDGLEDFKLDDFDMDSLDGEIADFNFDSMDFSSLDSIDSVVGGGSAKDSVSKLILLNSQIAEQLSGENIESVKTSLITVEELVVWKKINFDINKFIMMDSYVIK